MAEAVKWGKKKARINSISPGIIVTPLAIDEFNGKRGAFYKICLPKHQQDDQVQQMKWQM